MTAAGSVVLSTLEFDVLWDSERLPARHVALDVPSPGTTHTERAELVRAAMADLAGRGLVKADRALPELADRLSLLAHPAATVDSWVWTDHEISALAAVSGDEALLAVVDGPQVWLIPTRPSAVASAAVSVAGEMPAGPGFSVSVPTTLLHDAERKAGVSPAVFIATLMAGGVTRPDANALAMMLSGMGLRGQLGVERRQRDQRMRRAARVLSFHDTEDGRYLYLRRPAADGTSWSTVTPADNALLAASVTELLGEV